MKVFVAGATGAVGTPAVAALIRAGHDVTGVARTPQKAAQLKAQGATPVTVSIFDAEDLAEVFAGHDAVINLATHPPSLWTAMWRRSWREHSRIRRESSAAIAAAVRRTGVPRYIQESVVFSYPDRGDEWIDETVEAVPFSIVDAALEAEKNTRSVDGVVLRFGMFYGPQSRETRQFLALARSRIGVQIGRRRAYHSSIHLDDAAEAVVAALAAPPGVYNVVDDEPLTCREYTDAHTAAIGKRTLVRGPGVLAQIGSPLIVSLTRSTRASNARFKAATGWTPRYRSVRDGLAPTPEF